MGIIDKQKKTKKKYVIVSPRQKWGGAIALHSLCKNIENEGCDAKIFYTQFWEYDYDKKLLFWIKHIKWFILDTVKCSMAFLFKPKRLAEYYSPPIKGCRRKWLPFVDENTIVVYPEVVYGNPLSAKKVVRWLLYYYKFYGCEGAYSHEDLFIAYRKIFNCVELNPNEYIVNVPYFDLDLYKQTNFGKREGDCYIIRKGSNRTDLPESFNGIIIDSLTEREKVDCFNKCKRCISYDLETAYSSIASLCGCDSIVVLDPQIAIEKYRNEQNPRLGIAIGFEETEIQKARMERSLLRQEFNEINTKATIGTQKFLKICDECFFTGKFQISTYE